MLRKAAILAPLLGMSAAAHEAAAESIGFTVRASVPMHCVVRHSPPAGTIASGTLVSLGSISEFCNAAEGYELIVTYMPGSLEGAVLYAGEDSVVLDGSGEAVVSRSNGPRILERALNAAPGKAGFDTSSLTFELRPA